MNSYIYTLRAISEGNSILASVVIKQRNRPSFTTVFRASRKRLRELWNDEDKINKITDLQITFDKIM